MKTRDINQRKARGFTALEMMVVIAILVLLAVLVLSELARRTQRSARVSCVSNLKQIGLAARMWSNDNGDKFAWQVSIANTGTLELVNAPSVFPLLLVMSNELNSARVLVCEHDKQRTKVMLWSDLSDKHLSYFVGLDADETKPQTILSGDRNLSGGVRVTNTVFHFTSNSVVGFTKDLHNQYGNLGFGDGSSQQISPDALGNHVNTALLSSGQPALRLAIP